MYKLLVAVVVGVILFGGLATILLPRRASKVGTSPQTQTTIKRSDIKEVILKKKGFSPASVTIKRGETVTWINQSGSDAGVNSVPHPTHNLHRFLNLGVFPNGSSVQATFETSGSYNYHNHLSPQQRGTVVVK